MYGIIALRGIKRMRRRFFSTQQGFTLIELMVVIVILGILATFIMPRIMGRPEEARRMAAKAQIQSIESALRLFKLDNGFYPSTEQGLEALVYPSTTGRVPEHFREGGYLEKGKVPMDPWGHPYVYLSPGINMLDYDLKSLGSDGEEGGEGPNADVESWNLES